MERAPLKYRPLMAASIQGHPKGLQIVPLVPLKMMLDIVIGLLEGNKAGIQSALGTVSCINEMVQGKDVMGWRLSGPEAC